MAKGYRIGYSEETTAWKVLEFEYIDLDNRHTLQDLSNFLGMGKAYLSMWSTLQEFRRRYGDVRGIWLCTGIIDALTFYGAYYGEGNLILEYNYDPRKVVVDLGEDGFFVLEPTFIRERGPDPLAPLKRDLARVLRWPRRR